MIKFTVLCITLLLAIDVFAFPSYDKKRSIEILGRITNLEEEKDRLLELSQSSYKPINIIIDSPGGSVMAGLRFIQEMDRVKARGVEIRCVVRGMAASMAMHIFGNCSKRYAFETSLLLWHPAYVFVQRAPITTKEAERIKAQLILLTELLEKRLRKALALPLKVYEEYYYNEYFVAAERLSKMSPNFLQLIEDY